MTSMAMVDRIAVVGATGAVGREILRVLEEREFPAGEVIPFASARSAGSSIAFNGSRLTVRELADGWHEGIDLSLSSAGAGVARWALPPAAAAGTVCIDNSSAFRMDPSVPLVVPEVNPEALAGHSNLIANGNCTAITALMAIGPLHRAFGLTFLLTSSYQSVSGAGMKGIRELAEQIEKLHGQEEALGMGAVEPSALPIGDVFPRTIAYNVVPLCERFDPDGSGYSTEELKLGAEVRKVLGLPDLPVAATAVRVPVPVGHAVSVFARFERDVTPDAARSVLQGAPGVRVMDLPMAGEPAGEFPTPLDAAGDDDVLVGRIRAMEGDPHALLLFCAGDNLRKGAALNAVQIAEMVVASGMPDATAVADRA
jgi:aspartate-semialdehyde dehydrogenase